jgi:hypothetical protein
MDSNGTFEENEQKEEKNIENENRGHIITDSDIINDIIMRPISLATDFSLFN